MLLLSMKDNFFKDLKKFVVKVCEVYDKRVIVCGLMTDANEINLDK